MSSPLVDQHNLVVREIWDMQTRAERDEESAPAASSGAAELYDTIGRLNCDEERDAWLIVGAAACSIGVRNVQLARLAAELGRSGRNAGGCFRYHQRVFRHRTLPRWTRSSGRPVAVLRNRAKMSVAAWIAEASADRVRNELPAQAAANSAPGGRLKDELQLRANLDAAALAICS